MASDYPLVGGLISKTEIENEEWGEPLKEVCVSVCTPLGWETTQYMLCLVDYCRRGACMCRIPRIETRGIWGRKGKERSTAGSPRCTRTDNEGDDDQECLFDFGRERSTTKIGGQQLHLRESPTKDNRRNKRKDWRKGWNERERMKKKRERRLGLGSGVKG